MALSRWISSVKLIGADNLISSIIIILICTVSSFFSYKHMKRQEISGRQKYENWL